MDLIIETRGSTFSIEVGYFDTVLEIKEKIEKYQRIPVPKQTLVYKRIVLQDHHNIEQCNLFNKSRLQLLIRQESNPDQSPQPNSTVSSSSSNNNNNEKLRVMVVLKWGTMIPMKVNKGDTVGELRKEMAKIKKKYEFDLPEGYFFMHKQNVMDDGKSFLWHRVDQGDKIEIINGPVPIGS